MFSTRYQNSSLEYQVHLESYSSSTAALFLSWMHSFLFMDRYLVLHFKSCSIVHASNLFHGYCITMNSVLTPSQEAPKSKYRPSKNQMSCILFTFRKIWILLVVFSSCIVNLLFVNVVLSFVFKETNVVFIQTSP